MAQKSIIFSKLPVDKIWLTRLTQLTISVDKIFLLLRYIYNMSTKSTKLLI